jgi:hypothetical protein
VELGPSGVGSHDFERWDQRARRYPRKRIPVHPHTDGPGMLRRVLVEPVEHGAAVFLPPDN